jgi:hypothetical protein
MEYKRLKENLQILDAHNHGQGKVINLTGGQKTESILLHEVISDCREILNKIEQGKMIECNPKLIGECVVGIHQHTDGTYSMDLDEENIVIGFCSDGIVTANTTHAYNDYFKNGLYFIDNEEGKAEAENRLKELQE